MVVRIRFGKRLKADAKRAQNRRVAQGIAALLTPAALMACMLGVWGIGADFKWTSSFAIPTGLFSHWQFWIGTAALLQLCSYALNRYGNSDRAAS
jgi:hypothetical protein